jgi:hypothetical protein
MAMLRRNPDRAFDLAALAANEGLTDEAVRALKEPFAQCPLVIFFFQPTLPWFRSLAAPRQTRCRPGNWSHHALFLRP